MCKHEEFMDMVVKEDESCLILSYIEDQLNNNPEELPKMIETLNDFLHDNPDNIEKVKLLNIYIKNYKKIIL